MRSAAKKSLDGRHISWGTDDQDLSDTTSHKSPDWVVNHRLVVDREELLADTLRGWVKAAPAATGEYDPLHEPPTAITCSRARATCQTTVAFSALPANAQYPG